MKKALWIAAGPLLRPDMSPDEVRAWHSAFRPWGALVSVVCLAVAFVLAGDYLGWWAQPHPCHSDPSPWACLSAPEVQP